jgi:hypothetical protein
VAQIPRVERDCAANGEIIVSYEDNDHLSGK